MVREYIPHPAPSWEKTSTSKNMTANEILKEVAKCHMVSVEEIKSKSKTKHVAWARAHACYLIKLKKDFSLNQIARIVCRDHTTVLSAIQGWPNKARKNAFPKGRHDRIQRKVKGPQHDRLCCSF